MRQAIETFSLLMMVAEACFIGLRIAENHRAHISGKLGLHGSYSLLKFALENISSL